MHIQIHNADHPYRLESKRSIYSWLDQVIRKEGFKTGNVDLILCSDEYLLEINRSHLQHDYYTDIITFDYCENKTVSGELYLSVDRIRDNAKSLSISFKDELHRVMVHGVLHLCGYKDKSPKQAELMRSKEDNYLTLRTF